MKSKVPLSLLFNEEVRSGHGTILAYGFQSIISANGVPLSVR